MANIISAIKLPNGDKYNIKDEISNYAVQTGSYDDMTVGTAKMAEGFAGAEFKSDSTPYLHRPIDLDGFEVGDRSYNEEIIGGTVAWNQLVANSGSVSVTVPSGHKYFSNIGGTKAIAISNGSAISATGGTDNIVDLTALFGSAEIADYVYSLEQTTAGAGVAWLKSHGFIDGSYRAYDSGSLQSVKTSEHKTVGFNQFNKSDVTPNSTINSSGEMISGSHNVSGMIKVIPNTNYYVKDVIALIEGHGVCVYDSEAIFIGVLTPGSSVSRTYGQVTTPTNALYMRAMTDNLDPCVVNISDASKNGTYEPYEVHTYPLDSDLELRGLFKLDSSNNLYAEGDVYESSGAVSRKYGIVDLGTLTWTKGSTATEGIYRFSGNAANSKSVALGLLPNIVCSKFVTIKGVNSYQGTEYGIAKSQNSDEVFASGEAYNSMSASDFKTAMSGVYLVYELATPTTETAQPYQRIQIVDNNGTEGYVDTRSVPIPVGHQTKYIKSNTDVVTEVMVNGKPVVDENGVANIDIEVDLGPRLLIDPDTNRLVIYE